MTPTRAIILAAGRGTRLAPYTDDRPKCMVEIDGRTLLDYGVANLKQAGVSEIAVVTGYRRNAVPKNGLREFHNERFATTNMVESLFCAREAMKGALVVAYGDIVYEPGVLERLLADSSDVSVVLDDNWKKLWVLRSEDPLADAETLVLDGADFITEIGGKSRDESRIQSQYIGLMKFSPQGVEILKSTYDAIQSLGEGMNIIRGRSRQNIYMTDLLQFMIDRGTRVKGLRVQGGWFEVDTKSDYEMILKMAADGHLKEFCDLGRIS